jgi:hypothetical protein
VYFYNSTELVNIIVRCKEVTGYTTYLHPEQEWEVSPDQALKCNNNANDVNVL